MYLIDTITRPSYRPHYAFCPSVCPSVLLSVFCPVRALTRKQRNAKKSKLARKGLPILSSKGQSSRSRDVKTSTKFDVMFTHGQQCRRIERGRLHTAYAIVRPTSLSAHEALGNGTDCRIQCRCGHLLFREGKQTSAFYVSSESVHSRSQAIFFAFMADLLKFIHSFIYFTEHKQYNLWLLFV